MAKIIHAPQARVRQLIVPGEGVGVHVQEDWARDRALESLWSRHLAARLWYLRDLSLVSCPKPKHSAVPSPAWFYWVDLGGNWKGVVAVAPGPGGRMGVGVAARRSLFSAQRAAFEHARATAAYMNENRWALDWWTVLGEQISPSAHPSESALQVAESEADYTSLLARPGLHIVRARHVKAICLDSCRRESYLIGKKADPFSEI